MRLAVESVANFLEGADIAISGFCHDSVSESSKGLAVALHDSPTQSISPRPISVRAFVTLGVLIAFRGSHKCQTSQTLDPQCGMTARYDKFYL